MTVADRFNPSWTCPRPGRCYGERFCQEIAPCTGEPWRRAQNAERDRLREELDRQGIPHNLNEPAKDSE